METPRYNIFHQVHQGLRALLYHASLQVQQTDFNEQDAADETLDLIDEVIFLYEGHAHTEDTMVFPLIANHAPDVVADFEKQHHKDHILGAHLADSVKACRNATSPEARVAAGIALQFSLAEFTAFNLSHMNMEEAIVKKIICDHYTDEQLHALTGQIVAQIPPDKNARYSYWMLKGLTTAEIIGWFQAIRAQAPPFVFDQMMGLATSALDAKTLARVQDAFAPEVVA